MRAWPIASLLLLAACGAPPPATIEDQAARLVWHELYGVSGEPPAVEWRRDVCPSRADGPPAVLWGETCYAGLYLPGDHIYCAVRATPSASALSHELMHARQWIVSTVEDPQHLRQDDWQAARDADATLRTLGM